MRPNVVDVDEPLGSRMEVVRTGLMRRLSRVSWRLARHLPDRYWMVPAAGGRQYLNLSESPMAMARLCRTYEHWKMQMVRRLVRRNMVMLDIGANLGDYALLCARLTRDQADIHAFEPSATSVRWLRRSIAANGYRSISVHGYALSSSDGERAFYPGAVSGWGSFFPGGSQIESPSIRVHTRRLDGVVRELGLSHVDLIKIDVQGAELLVLKGASDLLSVSADLQLLLDVDVATKEERAELYDLLRSHRFAVYRIGPSLTKLDWIELSVKDVFATKSLGT